MWFRAYCVCERSADSVPTSYLYQRSYIRKTTTKGVPRISASRVPGIKPIGSHSWHRISQVSNLSGHIKHKDSVKFLPCKCWRAGWTWTGNCLSKGNWNSVRILGLLAPLKTSLLLWVQIRWVYLVTEDIPPDKNSTRAYDKYVLSTVFK